MMNLTSISDGMWKFSPIPNIEESNFIKILERFYNMGSEASLVRIFKTYLMVDY